jgi:uroporphyrinogen decarboxylase
MTDALECKKTLTKLPRWELEFHCWDQLFEGKRLIIGKEFTALTPKEAETALHTNTELFIEGSKKLGFDALTVPGNYWEIAPGEPSYYWLPEDAQYKQIKLLSAANQDLMLIAVTGGVMAMPDSSDYVEFSYKLFVAPEEIDETAKAIFSKGCNTASRMVDAGIGAVVTASDLGDNSGPFFNPEQMERYIYPYLHDWAEYIEKLGLFSILHCDGNITNLIEPLANSGIDALQAIDPLAGMDIFKVKEQIGDKICLCGNIDCGIIVLDDKKAIKQQTDDLTGYFTGKRGFVLGASNAIAYETDINSYLVTLNT